MPDIPGVSHNTYYDTVVERFSNPAIGDTIARLCFDGSNRQPKFIIPVIQDRLDSGETIDGLALESALWCRYCYGISESGATIAPNDPAWDRLTEQARLARDNPHEWLAMADIYGSVADSEIFQAAFAEALNAIWKDGTAATLRAYSAG